MTEKMHYATYGGRHRRRRRADPSSGTDRILRRGGQGSRSTHSKSTLGVDPPPASPNDVAVDPVALAELDGRRRRYMQEREAAKTLREGARDGEGGLIRIPRRDPSARGREGRRYSQIDGAGGDAGGGRRYSQIDGTEGRNAGGNGRASFATPTLSSSGGRRSLSSSRASSRTGASFATPTLSSGRRSLSSSRASSRHTVASSSMASGASSYITAESSYHTATSSYQSTTQASSHQASSAGIHSVRSRSHSPHSVHLSRSESNQASHDHCLSRSGSNWDGRTRHYDPRRGTSYDGLRGELAGFDLTASTTGVDEDDDDGRRAGGRGRGRGRSLSLGRRGLRAGRRSLSAGRRTLRALRDRSRSVGRGRSLSVGRRRRGHGNDHDDANNVDDGHDGGMGRRSRSLVRTTRGAASFLKERVVAPLLPVLRGQSCRKSSSRGPSARGKGGNKRDGGRGCGTASTGDGSATYLSHEGSASYCSEDSYGSGDESSCYSSSEEEEEEEVLAEEDRRVSFMEGEEGGGASEEEEEVFHAVARYYDSEEDSGSEDSGSYDEEEEDYTSGDDESNEGTSRRGSHRASFASRGSSRRSSVRSGASSGRRETFAARVAASFSSHDGRGPRRESFSARFGDASGRGASFASKDSSNDSSHDGSGRGKASDVGNQIDPPANDDDDIASEPDDESASNEQVDDDQDLHRSQARRLLEENESLRVSVKALRADFEALLRQMTALDDNQSCGGDGSTGGGDGNSIATDSNSRASHCLRKIDEVKAVAAARLETKMAARGRRSSAKRGGMDSDVSVCLDVAAARKEEEGEGGMEGYQECIDDLRTENERLYEKVVALSHEREEILAEVRTLRGSSAADVNPIEAAGAEVPSAKAPLLTTADVAKAHHKTMDEVASLINNMSQTLSTDDNDDGKDAAELARKLKANAMGDEILGLVSRILAQRTPSGGGSAPSSGDCEGRAVVEARKTDGEMVPSKNGGEGSSRRELELRDGTELELHPRKRADRMMESFSVCTVTSTSSVTSNSTNGDRQDVIDNNGISTNSLFDGTQPSTKDPAGRRAEYGDDKEDDDDDDDDDETLEIIYEYESDDSRCSDESNRSSSSYQDDCYDQGDDGGSGESSFPSEDVDEPPHGYHRFSPGSSRHSSSGGRGHSRSPGRSRRSSVSSRARKSSFYSHCSSYASSRKDRASSRSPAPSRPSRASKGRSPSPGVRSRASSKRSSGRESGRSGGRSGRSSFHSRRSSHDTSSTKERVKSIIEEAKAMLRLQGHDEIPMTPTSAQDEPDRPVEDLPQQEQLEQSEEDIEEILASAIDRHLVDSPVLEGFDDIHSACASSAAASADGTSQEPSYGSESTRERKGICITVVTRSSRHISFPSSQTHTYVTFFRANMSKEQVDAVLEEQFQETREVLESSIATDRLDNRGSRGRNAMKRRKFQGEYNAKGERHGYGIYTSKNGNEYRGEWQCDKREGLGVVKIGQGDVFEGQFEGNLKNGIGVYHYKDGECDLSRYHDDLRVGDSVRYSKDRTEAFLLSEDSVGTRAISLEEAADIAKKMGTIVAA